jgi:Fe-S cluster biosynthesis and repair protein YggX
MAIQRYPIGLQDFKEVISKDYIYVDKTRYVHQLLTNYKYYFLSRPRRFGKSLFLSTLYYLFKGEKSLFEGLYVADKWDFEEYPVIRISFSTVSYEYGRLAEALQKELIAIGLAFDIEISSTPIKDVFEELIQKLFHKYQKQVVILIDEYDKPIIDYLDKDYLQQARENRSILKSFYSILKDADPYLKLVFITGISKFSQVSIFSDLNNLYDITLERTFNEVCGISEQELEQYFPQELKFYDREKIKYWYNGYRWHSKGYTLYNPFSLLRFFSAGDYVNFWYATGTPTFLIELSKELRLYELKNAELSTSAMNSFNLDNLQLLPLLFQTGYLTISGYDDVLGIYQLDYPNAEVRSSYLEGLLELYSFHREPLVPQTMSRLLRALKEKNPEQLQEAINAAFAHIPYPLWQKDNEYFYHAIIHLLFSLLGVYIHSEVHTKQGRADALIQIDEGVFCLEFKLEKSAEEAIAQIRDKGYLQAFQNTGKPCHAIGINFSREKKEVAQLLWEEMPAEG